MKDKREECKCHKECVTIEHECDKPCKWPLCLTKEESEELIKSINPSDFA